MATHMRDPPPLSSPHLPPPPPSLFQMATHMRDPDGSIDARWNYWGTKPEIDVQEVNNYCKHNKL